MILAVIFSCFAVADMGVNLGCSDSGMAQKVLNDAEVGAAIKQVSCEAVTQPVRG